MSTNGCVVLGDPRLSAIEGEGFRCSEDSGTTGTLCHINSSCYKGWGGAVRMHGVTCVHICFVFLGDCQVVQDFELQRQVLCALNAVLYEQLQFKGNECDYYNPMNSYIHQVRR